MALPQEAMINLGSHYGPFADIRQWPSAAKLRHYPTMQADLAAGAVVPIS